MIFCGKTETLISKDNKNYQLVIDSSFRKEIADFQNEFKFFNYLIGKTSGWVTEFINFSISDIDKNSKNNREFFEKFKLIFPELNEIIDKLRFR